MFTPSDGEPDAFRAHEHTARIDTLARVQLLRSQRTIDLATMLVYWRYIETTIVQYRKAAAAVTTPSGHSTATRAFDPAFRFADVQDPMSPPAPEFDSALTSVLEQYFEVEDRLAASLKYLLQSVAVVEFQPTRDLVFEVLSLFRSFEHRESLLSMHDASLQEELRRAVAMEISEVRGEHARLGLLGPVESFARHVLQAQRVLEELTEAMKTLLMEQAGEMSKASGVLPSGHFPRFAGAFRAP